MTIMVTATAVAGPMAISSKSATGLNSGTIVRTKLAICRLSLSVSVDNVLHLRSEMYLTFVQYSAKPTTEIHCLQQPKELVPSYRCTGRLAKDASASARSGFQETMVRGLGKGHFSSCDLLHLRTVVDNWPKMIAHRVQTLL